GGVRDLGAEIQARSQRGPDLRPTLSVSLRSSRGLVLRDVDVLEREEPRDAVVDRVRGDALEPRLDEVLALVVEDPGCGSVLAQLNSSLVVRRVTLGRVGFLVGGLGEVVEGLARVAGPRGANAAGRPHGRVPVLLVREVRAPAEEEQLRRVLALLEERGVSRALDRV